jgi:hypothetical protein
MSPLLRSLFFEAIRVTRRVPAREGRPHCGQRLALAGLVSRGKGYSNGVIFET